MYYSVPTTVLTPAVSLPLESSTLSRAPVMNTGETLRSLSWTLGNKAVAMLVNSTQISHTAISVLSTHAFPTVKLYLDN